MTRLLPLSFLVAVALLPLRPAAAESGDGQIVVRVVSGPQLVVFLDGRVVGKTPLEIGVAPGDHEVALRLEEFLAKQLVLDVSVAGGQTTALVADWEDGQFTLDTEAMTARATVSIDLAGADGRSLPEDAWLAALDHAEVVLLCGERTYPLATTGSPAPGSSIPFARRALPPGDCELRVSCGAAATSTSVALQRGTVFEDSFQLKLPWSRVTVEPRGDRDRVQLQPDQGGGEFPLGGDSTIDLGPAPVLAVPGRYSVSVIRGGTEIWSSSVTLRPGDQTLELYGRITWHADLAPRAEVTASGQTLSSADGWLLPPGDWKIRVEAPGSHPWEGAAKVVVGGTSNLSPELHPIEPGRLLVRSTVSLEDARIEIDGVRRTARIDGHALDPGVHIVEVNKPGYRPTWLEVTIEEGDTATVDVELVAQPTTLRFRGLPEGARVEVTGPLGSGVVEANETSGQAALPVSPGSNSYRVVAPGWFPQEGEVELAAGAERELFLEFEPSEVRVVWVGLPRGATVAVRSGDEDGGGGGSSEASVPSAQGRAEARVPAGESLSYAISAPGFEDRHGTIGDDFTLEDRVVEVTMKPTVLRVAKRRAAGRSAVFGIIGATLAATGAVMLGVSSTHYGQAEAHNDTYLGALTEPGARAARQERDAALDRGAVEEIVGWSALGLGGASFGGMFVSIGVGAGPSARPEASIPSERRVIVGATWSW